MDRRHRTAIRRSTHRMRQVAADLSRRRGHVPRDEPPGYVDAFVASLRDLGGVLKALPKDATVVDAKRRSLAIETTDEAHVALGRTRAMQAALTLLNQEAAQAGLDAFTGMLETD